MLNRSQCQRRPKLLRTARHSFFARLPVFDAKLAVLWFRDCGLQFPLMVIRVMVRAGHAVGLVHQVDRPAFEGPPTRAVKLAAHTNGAAKSETPQHATRSTGTRVTHVVNKQQGTWQQTHTCVMGRCNMPTPASGPEPPVADVAPPLSSRIGNENAGADFDVDNIVWAVAVRLAPGPGVSLAFFRASRRGLMLYAGARRNDGLKSNTSLTRPYVTSATGSPACVYSASGENLRLTRALGVRVAPLARDPRDPRVPGRPVGFAGDVPGRVELLNLRRSLQTNSVQHG